MRKEDRLELINKARNGEIYVIISTLVGEEGVDIPEAGLLIMMNVPKSPLRFYQRLGRLIRMSKDEKKDEKKHGRIKYLAISLTPKTVEYWDLEDALCNLYGEGVDVSYIVVNLAEKTPSSRVLDILNQFSRTSNEPVQYTLLAFGWELGNPLTYITEFIKKRKELAELVCKHMIELRKHMIERGFTVETDEDLDIGVYYLLTFHMFRWGDVKKVLKSIDNAVNKSNFSKEFSRAILEKKIFYVYDVGMLSEIISYQLRELYRSCNQSRKLHNRCSDEFFRIDRKSILRLFIRAFPYNNISDIICKIRERLENNENYLEELKQEGIIQNYNIWIKWGKYNVRNKSYSPRIVISLKLNNIWISQYAQINYFDISKDIYEDENIRELMKINLLTIGYEASKKFLEQLYEPNE